MARRNEWLAPDGYPKPDELERAGIRMHAQYCNGKVAIRAGIGP